ncbi:putative winged helix-like DNA-binding domain superfamily [Helianthus anomalus]
MAFYPCFILLLPFCLSHMCCYGSYIIQKQKDPSKAHQIKLEMIVKALKWLQMEMDLDEVECIMSILIYKNLVKGYFAHKSKVAVLSKQDPFPKLNGKPINA